MKSCERSWPASGEYEEKYGTAIPVIAAGGIFDRGDVTHALSLGVDGVQIASRFVATKECDAAEAYKQAYIRAEEKDIAIIESSGGYAGAGTAQCLYPAGGGGEGAHPQML